MTGRQQQQRQLRKVIRTFFRPSTLGISTWLGLSALAQSLTLQIKGSSSEPSLAAGRDHRTRLSGDVAGLSEVRWFPR